MDRTPLGKALQSRLTEQLSEQVDRRVDEILGELREARAELRQARDQLADAVRMLEVRQRRDMYFAGEVRAVGETERFVAEHLVGATPFPNPEATLRFAAELVSTDGIVVQCGAGDGNALRILIAKLHERDLYGFEPLTGLPEDWRPGYPAGALAQSAAPKVPGATMITGPYEDTLPKFLAEHPEPIAFLHVNTAVYSATRAVLEAVGDRLSPGAIVVFNEYFNYPGWQHGEFRAWAEFVEQTGRRFQYEAYTFDNEQAVLRLIA